MHVVYTLRDFLLVCLSKYVTIRMILSSICFHSSVARVCISLYESPGFTKMTEFMILSTLSINCCVFIFCFSRRPRTNRNIVHYLYIYDLSLN